MQLSETDLIYLREYEMSPDNAGRLLGVSGRAVKNWMDRGIIPFSQSAAGWRRISSDVVAELLRLYRDEKISLNAPAIRPYQSWFFELANISHGSRIDKR